jgi:hypothetical protein
MWESKEAAERISTDHTMPSLHELGVEGDPPINFQEFELPYVVRG